MSSQTFRRGTPALPDPSELRSAPDDKNPPSEGDSPTVNRGFRPDVEGLRALAVVAVIVDHLFDWPSGGFVGVDVFFVISGFLITGLLLKEYERTKTISFLDFYKRRVRRIMPAALLVLVVSTAVSFLVFNVVRAQASLWDAVWSALFVSNWHFASAGTDYFASDGPISPFRHYWSLSVEEQFYLVWPVLIFLVITFARRRTPKNRVKRARLFTQTIGITVGVLIVASLAWGFYETSARPTVAYFSTFSRAWELGIGALLAIFAARLATLPAAIRPVLGYVGLAGIIASFFVVSGDNAFPVPFGLLPVVATALVIASGIGGGSKAMVPITNPVTTYIGRLSFSLYLWHFPAIILLASLLGTGTLEYYGAAIGATLVLAIASFHLVEDPIRRSSWLDPKKAGRRSSGAQLKMTVAALSVVAVAVVGVVAVAVVRDEPTGQSQLGNGTPSTGGTNAPIEATGTALATRSEQVTAALATDEWPALDPAVESFGDFGRDVIAPEWAKDGCLGADLAKEKDAIQNTEHCVYGNAAAGPEKTAVIFGDSLAISYAPMLRSSLGDDWKVRVLTMARCPASTVTSTDTDGSEYTECTDFRNWALGEMNATKPALVLMSEAVDNSYLSSKATGGAADREWQAGALTTMNSLKTAASNVIVLSRPPAATALVECKTPTSSPNDCQSTVSPSFISHARTMEAAATEVGAPVQFINTQGWFCSQGTCPAFVNGIPVRGDTSHLTARQSQDLAPIMSDELATLGLLAPAAG
ncbi:acyltransferase family protein [Clavibacter michiganensis]|uniref:acyltransferase family protein n=1 Tax=Clavibacter michiganensis TaxID=28447 RepID=UPI00292D21AA|nr:acyltransferase family protein [Clavibacter michiganensis]